jgi:hypothetical protein
MQDGNNRAFLDVDDTTNSTNVNVGELMLTMTWISAACPVLKITQTSVPAAPPLAPLSMKDIDGAAEG